ncbi:hypothetical protein K402DRAFT_403806 [Aulographum hederae CBS 113979]|uniref:MYND-type domain-containing protein n=1 Tax=Aulographum hederae CBS 113979 TaxID=1176131 RepID=A0A6G1H2L0_9PEZI|nr:hypothetical protein K402DRAFT_403806 [Aulographum hederae CBS 113979]
MDSNPAPDANPQANHNTSETSMKMEKLSPKTIESSTLKAKVNITEASNKMETLSLESVQFSKFSAEDKDQNDTETPIVNSPSVGSEALRCNYCGKDCEVKCAGCSGIPTTDASDSEAVMPAAYCNKECQKTDWKNHKPVCKAMQAKKKASEAIETSPESPEVLFCNHCGKECEVRCAG